MLEKKQNKNLHQCTIKVGKQPNHNYQGSTVALSNAWSKACPGENEAATDTAVPPHRALPNGEWGAGPQLVSNASEL